MFLCECDSCGRRELRGPRSLAITPVGATATCRGCGREVLVAAARPVAPAPPAPAEVPGPTPPPRVRTPKAA